MKKKPAAKTKRTGKGSKYSCDICGMVVTVTEGCDCGDACDLVCCDVPMKAA
jgi:hypothetical protein